MKVQLKDISSVPIFLDDLDKKKQEDLVEVWGWWEARAEGKLQEKGKRLCEAVADRKDIIIGFYLTYGHEDTRKRWEE